MSWYIIYVYIYLAFGLHAFFIFLTRFFFLIIYSGVSAVCDIYFVYGDVHLFLYLII